ncbi:glucokinase, partial [Ascosphaera aggregata]
MAPSSPIIAWALPRIAEILPLDAESLTQLLEYASTLSTEEAAAHLQNILGDSPATLEFVSSFNGMRRSAGFGVSTSGKSTPSSARASPSASRNSSRAPAAMGGKGKGAAQAPKPSSSASPGHYISEYLPNVRSKPARQPQNKGSSGGAADSSTKSKGFKSANSTTTNNLADLTSAIAALEISTNPTLSRKQERRKCNCAGTVHHLFTTAPNCLNCGKIICALEGLQPCSFCDKPLLSNDEIQEVIRELKNERGSEKMRIHNEGQQRRPATTSSSHDPTWNDSGLAAAKAHRDKLLSFQAQNAQRTKVIDEAADFETPNVGSTQWMTPAQKALALKKHQRILREMEEKAKPEWERKKMVMSLDVKTGKVIRMVDKGQGGTYEDEEMQCAKEKERLLEQKLELEAASSEHQLGVGTGAFGHNPLLASGGLVRPVWDPKGKGQATRHREQKQTWRRVQDDDDDNEQWILDGGLHGLTMQDNLLTTDEPPSRKFSVMFSIHMTRIRTPEPFNLHWWITGLAKAQTVEARFRAKITPAPQPLTAAASIQIADPSAPHVAVISQTSIAKPNLQTRKPVMLVLLGVLELTCDRQHKLWTANSGLNVPCAELTAFYFTSTEKYLIDDYLVRSWESAFPFGTSLLSTLDEIGLAELIFEIQRKGGKQGRMETPPLVLKAQKLAGEFEYRTDDILHGVTEFLREMDSGLAERKPVLPQIPTYVTAVPQGDEKGLYLAVDLGGTNFRVCSVYLNGDGTFTMRQSKRKIPEGHMRTKSYKPLFSYMAEQVDKFIHEHL